MPSDQLVFIGNWDRYKAPGGIGFAIARFDGKTGDLKVVGRAHPDIAVGNVCADPRRNILYCVDETAILPGNYQGGGGQVLALAVKGDGALIEISRQPSYGSLPSGVAIDPTGQYLIVTHHTDRTPITKVVREPGAPFRIVLEYDHANTVLFPLGPDGTIGAPCDLFKHSGDGGPLARQTHPQLHSVTASPSGELFLVCDKGNDEIVPFRIDREARKLAVCAAGPVKTPPGSSPRYTAFHPTRPFVFLNHETQAIVSAYRYSDAGELALIGTLGALPEGCADHPSMKQADILVHPNGRWLYDLIRGIAAVTMFRIDQHTGALEKVQVLPLDSQGPRGCAISADGRFMIVTAWEGHEVLILTIGEDGKLSTTGRKISQPNPSTVTFWPAGERAAPARLNGQ